MKIYWFAFFFTALSARCQTDMEHRTDMGIKYGIKLNSIRIDGVDSKTYLNLKDFVPLLESDSFVNCDLCFKDSTASHRLFIFNLLNASFDTNVFSRVYEIGYAYIKPSNERETENWLKIQEWHFKDETYAIEAFQLLKLQRKNVVYHAPPINWFFIRKGRYIYLVSSYHYGLQDYYFVKLSNKLAHFLHAKSEDEIVKIKW